MSEQKKYRFLFSAGGTGGHIFPALATANRLKKEYPDAEFLFIGAKPHTDFLCDEIARNETGFILTGADVLEGGELPKGWPLKRGPYTLETNVPGIFAVGDVREGVVRRVASAVGQGATAINLVHQYLKTV